MLLQLHHHDEYQYQHTTRVGDTCRRELVSEITEPEYRHWYFQTCQQVATNLSVSLGCSKSLKLALCNLSFANMLQLGRNRLVVKNIFSSTIVQVHYEQTNPVTLVVLRLPVQYHSHNKTQMLQIFLHDVVHQPN